MPSSSNRFKILLDSVQKTDPENWINFTPTTQRHEVYRSLLTQFSEGVLKLVKTAKDYVDTVYAQYGPTYTISVEWQEYNYSTDSYDTIYSLGRLNLSDKYKRSRDYTEVGFEPTDFVMNLLNRDEIPTALQTLTDMDGDAITTFTDETHTVSLDDQIMDFVASFTMVGPANFVGSTYSPTTESTLYVPVPIFNSELSNDKIITVLDISSGWLDFVPDMQIQFNMDGDVTIELTVDIDIEYREPSASTGYTLDGTSDVSLIYVKNDGSEVVVDSDTLPASDPSSPWPSVTLTGGTISLSGIVEGDELKFYLKLEDLTGSNPPNIQITGDASADITQSTTYEHTDCEVMFPWEVFLRLCQKITGRNDCLRSEFFGRTDGEVYTYGSDGEGAFYALTSVKLLRGFPLASNPINADLMGVFKAYDKMLLLGLGIVYDSGTPYVMIEKLEDFFDDSSSVTTFTVAEPGINWESAIKYMWGNVRAGYTNYKFNTNPALNSPHTPRHFVIPYMSEFVEKQYDAQCPFIVSGHLIELLRRERYDQANNKDTQYDEHLVVMHLKRDGGGGFERELDDDFSAVSNIDNETTNYNLHLTPARNMLRHAPLLLAGLAKRIIDTPAMTDFLRYMSGEGNTDAETTITGDTLVPEDDDLTRAMAAEVDTNTPFFDASEMGVCQVKVSKTQRELIKEGITEQVTITDGDDTYTGFIESIKEIDLVRGIAELKFLNNTDL